MMIPKLHLSALAALLVALSALLAACADSGEPEDAVEDYFKALVAQDEDRLFDAICPEWEADAQLERDTFWAVTAALEDMSCESSGKDGDLALVTCQGQIVLDYDGETRAQPLDRVTYLAREHDGEWKMCGFR